MRMHPHITTPAFISVYSCPLVVEQTRSYGRGPQGSIERGISQSPAGTIEPPRIRIHPVSYEKVHKPFARKRDALGFQRIFMSKRIRFRTARTPGELGQRETPAL